MNVSTPDAPQPGARPEGAVLRFLRWLDEPPVEAQRRELRVLRWLLRAGVFLLGSCIVAEISPDYGPGSDATFDYGASGNAGVGPKGGKPGEPPA